MADPTLPSFADTLGTTVLLHDPKSGRILDANAAAELLYGYPTTTLTGIHVGLLSSSSPRFSGERARDRIRLAAEGDPQEFEWQIRRSDGELRWVLVTLRPYTVGDDRFVLAEIHDRTDAKTRARRLRLLNRVIRHNLRNDMTVVRGHADSLRRALEDGDRERQAEVIVRVAEDIGSLTDTVSRIEDLAGNDESDFRPIRLDSLLKTLAADYRDRYPHARIAVETAGGIVVSAHRGLRYGIENAVENAVEHNDRGEPSVVLRSTTVDDGERAADAIEDDGPPIPPIEIDAVASDTEVTDMRHGTGVGLFAMKWCAESLGGKLDISHRSSRGNLVEFTVPIGETGTRADDRETEPADCADR